MNKTDVLNPGRHPIRVAQFGTGNFLRAFVDYMIDVANEKGCFDGDVAMVKQVNYAVGQMELKAACCPGKPVPCNSSGKTGWSGSG